MEDSHETTAGVRDVIADVWREALGVDVLPKADFFELGGHSLLAMEVAEEVKVRLGVEIHATLLFDRSNFDDFVAAVACAAAIRPR